MKTLLKIWAVLSSAALFAADAEPHMKTKLCNTAETNCVEVKSSSTAPIASDKAAVVVQSPNGNHSTAANQTSVIGSKSAGAAATNSILNGCVYNSSGISLTNGEQASCQHTVDARIKVDTVVTPTSGSVPSVNSKIRYEDMNATTGGVARETLVGGTFTQIYSHTGSGLLLGTVVNLENKDKWYVRIVVDGEEIFGASGIFTGDLVSNDAYDLDDGGSPLSASEGRLGISMEEHDRFVWTATLNFPIRYTSSLKIYIRRSDASSKKFKAGLVILTKET